MNGENCLQCGKDIPAENHIKKHKARKFCSKSCSSSYKKNRLDKSIKDYVELDSACFPPLHDNYIVDDCYRTGQEVLDCWD